MLALGRGTIGQASYHRGNANDREQIAEAGHRRVLRKHTWQARFTDLFARLGLIPKIPVGDAARAEVTR